MPDQKGPLPTTWFARADESPDALFYQTPRFVTHIDDDAIAAVTQLYREYFPAGGAVLDLMSSWISHLPHDVSYRRVVGLGMNHAEMAEDKGVDAWIVTDLNTQPQCRFNTGGV